MVSRDSLRGLRESRKISSILISHGSDFVNDTTPEPVTYGTKSEP